MIDAPGRLKLGKPKHAGALDLCFPGSMLPSPLGENGIDCAWRRREGRAENELADLGFPCVTLDLGWGRDPFDR